MIEKRLVQWYAADAGVDLDIAEREVVLTYVMKVLSDHGLLSRLAFKGGTAIRKIFLGTQGRFSLDLDFTMASDAAPEEFVLDLVGVLHDQQHYAIHFAISPQDYYANADSCGASVTYQHDWVTNGKFSIQVSFRARPILLVKTAEFIRERYFQWLGIELPSVPTLDLHEIIGEKIRATAQRSRVRDLYDLYQFTSLRFDRDKVRRLAIIKCWETNFAFDPEIFLSELSNRQYDWADLGRLIKHGKSLAPATIYEGIRRNYRFLTEMNPEEAALAGDAYKRERRVYQELLESLRNG
jgi:predicted nucleotidyltransferase component of viral defense system